MENITLNSTKLILFFLCIFMSSCTISVDDEEIVGTQEDIEGIWEFDTWLKDDVEQMDHTVESATIEFIKGSGKSGVSTWIINSVLGTTNEISPSYTLQDNDTQIDFNGDVFNIDLKSDRLIMEGTVSDSYWEVEMVKR